MKLRTLALGVLLILSVQAFAQRTLPPRVEPANDPVAWLADHENRLATTTQPSARLHLLINMAPAAFAAGDKAKAAAFAAELADLGNQLKDRPGFGPSLLSDATFISNQVLGHIAISDNRIDKAKEHLLKSAEVSGSPVLKSFGPGMALAKELLARNERDTVITYLELCGKFWNDPKVERGLLVKWKSEIEVGGKTDFKWASNPMNTWRFAQ